MFRILRWNPRTAGPATPSNRKIDSRSIVIGRPSDVDLGPPETRRARPTSVISTVDFVLLV
jgi:hypothetical protein